VRFKPPPRGLDRSIVLKLDIIDHENTLAIEDRLLRGSHDERSVESTLQLHRLIEMRVVPEGARIREFEAIGKGAARRDRSLHHSRPVHCRWNAQPMPVDYRRFG
jgi:hypothetical protein